jgi:hypothetical protein
MTTAAITEEIANLGIWVAVILVLFVAVRRAWGLPETIAACFVLFAASLGRGDIWTSAYATGRTLSPLLIVLGAISLRARQPLFAAPLILVLPRIALQYEAEAARALRNLM